MNKIKTFLSIINTTNLFIKTIITIVEISLSIIITYYSYYYINYIFPYFKKDYSNSKLIIENIKLFDWKIETAKIWSEYLLYTLMNSIFLILLTAWLIIGILGTISIIIRILQYISNNYDILLFYKNKNNKDAFPLDS